jgi:hypothetical protein
MQDYLEEWEVNNCIGILLTAIKGNISILNTFAKQTNSQITLGAYCYRNGKVPILNIESKNMRVIKRLNNVTLSLSID